MLIRLGSGQLEFIVVLPVLVDGHLMDTRKARCATLKVGMWRKSALWQAAKEYETGFAGLCCQPWHCGIKEASAWCMRFLSAKENIRNRRC
eukprot:4231088-Amphidinium_carterae.1